VQGGRQPELEPGTVILADLSLAGIEPDILSIADAAYKLLGKPRTRSDIRRLIQQGSIQLNGEKVLDPKAAPAVPPGAILRLDKTHAVRIAS